MCFTVLSKISRFFYKFSCLYQGFSQFFRCLPNFLDFPHVVFLFGWFSISFTQFFLGFLKFSSVSSRKTVPGLSQYSWVSSWWSVEATSYVNMLLEFSWFPAQFTHVFPASFKFSWVYNSFSFVFPSWLTPLGTLGMHLNKGRMWESFWFGWRNNFDWNAYE